MLRTSVAFFAAFVLGCAMPARAEGSGAVLSHNVEQARAALDHGSWDAYAPFYTWHAPWAYSRSRRDELNDFPFGGGIGRSVADTNGDRHSVYALAFRDSHYKAQYMAGYAKTTYWPAEGELRFGLGYTLFLFARSDIGGYVPLPFGAALASVRYREAELMVAAIPGTSHSGNVALVFARWSWD